MNIVAITQARLSSERFPRKVLKELNGQSLIQIQSARISRSRLVTQHLVATSDDPSDIHLISHCKLSGIPVELGSLADVLGRFFEISTRMQLKPDDLIIRLTGDCPLVSPELIDTVVSNHLRTKSDYSCLSLDHWPRGFDVEVFSKLLLDKANEETQDSFDREHVTPYIRESLANVTNAVRASGNARFTNLRMCVDVPLDLLFLQDLIRDKTTDEMIFLNGASLCELALSLPYRCNELVRQKKRLI